MSGQGLCVLGGVVEGWGGGGTVHVGRLCAGLLPLSLSLWVCECALCGCGWWIGFEARTGC